MSLISPYIGEQQLLKIILNQVSASNVGLHLYGNNHTPSPSDTLSNYTELVANGYAAVYLTGADWVIATTSGVTTATYPIQTFTMTIACSVYGYYVTDLSNMNLLWAEEFANAPISLSASGGTITITPTVSLQ